LFNKKTVQISQRHQKATSVNQLNLCWGCSDFASGKFDVTPLPGPCLARVELKSRVDGSMPSLAAISDSKSLVRHDQGCHRDGEPVLTSESLDDAAQDDRTASSICILMTFR
jgi:hypothetical protein